MNDYQKAQEKIARKYTSEIQELKFKIDELYQRIHDLQTENNCLVDENMDLREQLDTRLKYHEMSNQDLKILIKEAKAKNSLMNSYDFFLRNIGGFK